MDWTTKMDRTTHKLYITLIILILLLLIYGYYYQSRVIKEGFQNIDLKFFKGNASFNDPMQVAEADEEQLWATQSGRDPSAILPKKVFMYWHEENITNEFVRKNIEYLTKILSKRGYTLHLYNEKSILDEIGKEDAMKYQQNQSKQHFADYVRFFLLHKYGGFWFDSSIVIYNVDFLDKIEEEYRKYKFDVFLFEYQKRRVGDRYDGIYLENWFIAAPEHSIFIRDMLAAYKKALEIGFKKYKVELAERSVKFDKIFNGDDDTYLMQHAIVRLLISQNKYRIGYDYAENSMFKLQDQCNWDNNCLTEKLIKITGEEEHNEYGSKLIGDQREFINHHRKDDIPTIFSRLLAKWGHDSS